LIVGCLIGRNERGGLVFYNWIAAVGTSVEVGVADVQGFICYDEWEDEESEVEIVWNLNGIETTEGEWRLSQNLRLGGKASIVKCQIRLS